MNKSLFPTSSPRFVVIDFFILSILIFFLLFKDGYQYGAELEMSIDHFYFLFRKFCSFPDKFIDLWVILVFTILYFFIYTTSLPSIRYGWRIFSLIAEIAETDFILLVIFFFGQKSFNFIWSNLLILGAISCTLGEEVIS